MSFHRIAPLIYRDSRTGNFYERPRLAGKLTWRKLAVKTLKDAKELVATRRSDATRAVHGLCKDPYAPKPQTLGELISEYQARGCPDRSHNRRTGRALTDEHYRLDALKPFWSGRYPDGVKSADFGSYFAKRKAMVKRGHGGRTVDLELGTLSNVMQWAVSTGKAESNPFKDRPRFRNTKTIRHCRDYQPISGDELHDLAAHFFEDEESEVLGWQLLLQAMTGCRTSEVLKLRWDAKTRNEAGFIEGEWLWLKRSKGGVNPFAMIHPALKECIEWVRRWSLWRSHKSKWWFPSPRIKTCHVSSGALRYALAKCSPVVCGAHRNPHALRAFYVTVRRSQGILDGQIAAEIGDKTGAPIIISTYGSIPPSWRGGDGLSFMPTKGPPAWETLKMPANIVAMKLYAPVTTAQNGENRKSRK